MGSDFVAPQQKPRKSNDFPPLPYKDPTWAGEPNDDYYFEVIKQGSVLGKSGRISTSKVVVGRLPVCDIELEHPSVSRYHAVFQFKDDGKCFLYDLGSSHGTFLNKTQIEPKKYIGINVGDMIRFGASSRIYIFHGPEQEIQQHPAKIAKPKEEKIEVTWGFKDDAYEGDEWGANSIHLEPIDRSLIDDNAYYYKDPKKSLKVFLDNNDAEMEITYIEDEEDDEPMKYIAKLEITGLQGPFEASGRGKKKGSAERDACLEACAKLDRMGILKEKAVVESAAEKIKRLKEVYGDDEEDEDLYDRTQDSKKGNKNQILTAESLTEKKHTLELSIEKLEKELRHTDVGKATENDSEDELDKYMNEINVKMSVETKTKLEKDLKNLQLELQNTEKLLKLATPQSASSLLYSSVEEKKETKKVVLDADEFVKPAETHKTTTKKAQKRSHEKVDEDQGSDKLRKRASMVPTQQAMQKHYDLEGEEVVDVVYEYWENRTDLEDGAYYFIHYKGWKPSWDEWVPEERIFKFTEENKQRQLELRASMTAKQHKAPAEKKIIDTAAKDRKRRRESIADKEDEYLKKPEIKISVPESLKSQLVEDWEQVTKNQKLLPLPAETNVIEILDNFFTHYKENGKRKKDGQEDSMYQVVEGLKVYFEKALGIQLPTLIAHTNMDQEAVNILKDHFTTFLLYLQENQESLFNVDYEAAIPEYMSK
ncbi:Kanadaptin [Boothiomyces sp. JEL0866]|nr:Kanadaptin [Boothiomyces sp. JEL0866]